MPQMNPIKIIKPLIALRLAFDLVSGVILVLNGRKLPSTMSRSPNWSIQGYVECYASSLALVVQY